MGKSIQLNLKRTIFINFFEHKFTHRLKFNCFQHVAHTRRWYLAILLTFDKFLQCIWFIYFSIFPIINLFIHWSNQSLIYSFIHSLIHLYLTKNMLIRINNYRMIHCVKSVQIGSLFWSKYGKIRTRKNTVFGHFSPVI